MSSNFRKGLAVAGMLLLSASAAVFAADAYPVKPIRMIVAFPPGGPTDQTARLLAERMTTALGQQVFIDNRAGGNGIVGSKVVATSPPDGYTILFATVGTHAINAALYSKLPYDPVKDFSPIAMVGSTPNVLLVSPSLGVKSVRELIALAKATKPPLSYASGGNGTTTHLAPELFRTMAQIELLHVPYQGNSGALTDLLAGRVPIGFQAPGTALPYIRSNKLVALGVTGLKRSATLPEVPTISEAGLPGYEVSLWYGVLAPPGMPRDVVAKLNSTINQALQSPDFRKRLEDLSVDPLPGSPEQLGEQIRTDVAKWAKVVKDSGAQID